MTLQDYKDGQIILIDKPSEWSSFDVIKKIKYHILNNYKEKKIKIGHAGTLDPLATGLLIVCTGKFTKKIPQIQDEIKEYTGTIKLGATTASYDMETQESKQFKISHITKEKIHQLAQQMTGKQWQVPPVFSALKKDGKRLYEFARKNIEVDIPKRLIHIMEFEIVEVDMPLVHFRIVCSKGTYIRSIANDLGKSLNSGGYLTSLRRTKIGNWDVRNAISPEQVISNKII